MRFCRRPARSPETLPLDARTGWRDHRRRGLEKCLNNFRISRRSRFLLSLGSPSSFPCVSFILITRARNEADKIKSTVNEIPRNDYFDLIIENFSPFPPLSTSLSLSCSFILPCYLFLSVHFISCPAILKISIRYRIMRRGQIKTNLPPGRSPWNGLCLYYSRREYMRI